VGQWHPPHHERQAADRQAGRSRRPEDPHAADPMTVDGFQALGASTQQIAFGDFYIALQQGVVDGQENPLANIQSSKLH
jgi:hypothetical protein